MAKSTKETVERAVKIVSRRSRAPDDDALAELESRLSAVRNLLEERQNLKERLKASGTSLEEARKALARATKKARKQRSSKKTSYGAAAVPDPGQTPSQSSE